MKNIIKLAKEMVKRGLVEESTKNFFDVDGEIVRLIKKPGRTLMTCSCMSCSRNINEKHNMCSRKIAVILYQTQELKFKYIINSNLKYFEECQKLGLEPGTEVSIALLNDLKSFIL